MKTFELSVCLLALAMFVTGCRENSNDAVVENGDGQANVADAAESELDKDGYFPVFDSDYGQNTISNRMQKNFTNFYNTEDESEFLHLKSAGLKIYQPENLPVTEKFTGFLSTEAGASVIVLTSPFSMEKTISQIVADSISGGRTGILYRREIEIDGRQGVFYLVRETLAGGYVTKCITAFGNDEFSWIVTGTFNAELEADFGEEILKTLLNIKVAEEERLPPGEDVDFTIESNGRLVITDGFVDKVVFTLTGKFPGEITNKEPVFQVGKSLVKFDVENRKQVASRLISPTPAFRIDLVSSEREMKVNGLDGFEFVSIGTDISTDEQLVIYSAILFSEETGYVIHGWASSANETSYVSDFRALTESFKLKEK